MKKEDETNFRLEIQQLEACDLTGSPFPGPFRGKTSDW